MIIRKYVINNIIFFTYTNVNANVQSYLRLHNLNHVNLLLGHYEHWKSEYSALFSHSTNDIFINNQKIVSLIQVPNIKNPDFSKQSSIISV